MRCRQLGRPLLARALVRRSPPPLSRCLPSCCDLPALSNPALPQQQRLSPGADEPACTGFCARCGRAHSLPRTQAADAAADDLLATLRAAGRFDFDSPSPGDPRFVLASKYRSAERPTAQGLMVGVLLARDPAAGSGGGGGGGAVRVLRAFSGQLNGAWLVPGWAPPLGTVRHDTSAAYVAAIRRILQLGREAKAAAEAVRALSAPPSQPPAPAGAAASPLPKGWASRPALAAAEQRRAAARRAQAAVSRALAARIWAGYLVRSARCLAGGAAGAAASASASASAPLLSASLLGARTRGGTGDCCAPKLLQAALGGGLVPLSMSELWVGSPPPGGDRREGVRYAACAERCGPLMGHMLCGLDGGGGAGGWAAA